MREHITSGSSRNDGHPNGAASGRRFAFPQNHPPRAARLIAPALART